jgi:hypothetical protein
MHDKLLREALHDYPSEDSSKSPMENAVELTALPDIGPVSHAALDSWTRTHPVPKDIFTNTRSGRLRAGHNWRLPPKLT